MFKNHSAIKINMVEPSLRPAKRFNDDCLTSEDVYHYFLNRSRQLRGDNIALRPNTFLAQDYGCSIEFFDLVSGETYDSLYVYANKRNMGHMKRWALMPSRKTIITTPDCGLEAFLHNHQVPHRVVGQWTQWPEYREIASHYGDSKAERSGFYYMNHIDEGFAILKRLGATENTLKAWLLHPLFQTDLENFAKRNYGNLQIPLELMNLVMGYRDLANSYLPPRYREKPPHVWDPDLRLMLLADKIQNCKDMDLNEGLDPCRREELSIYFGRWFICLKREDEDRVQFQQLRASLHALISVP